MTDEIRPDEEQQPEAAEQPKPCDCEKAKRARKQPPAAEEPTPPESAEQEAAAPVRHIPTRHKRLCHCN